jgi:hypothetical protein
MLYFGEHRIALTLLILKMRDLISIMASPCAGISKITFYDFTIQEILLQSKFTTIIDHCGSKFYRNCLLYSMVHLITS